MKYEDLLKLLGDIFYKDIPSEWISVTFFANSSGLSDMLCSNASLIITEYIVKDLCVKEIKRIYKKIIINYDDILQTLFIFTYDGDVLHVYRFSGGDKRAEIFNDMYLSWWLGCIKSAKDDKNYIVIDI